jgi:hypothetical protein
LAALLPSTAALGSYDLRVDNGGVVSPAFRTTIVARKPGIVTANGDGQGPAQATLDGRLILQRNSNLGKIGQFDTRAAHPGERVDLWGTGLGADTASHAGGSSGDQTAAGQIRVVVNGVDSATRSAAAIRRWGWGAIRLTSRMRGGTSVGRRSRRNGRPVGPRLSSSGTAIAYGLFRAAEGLSPINDPGVAMQRAQGIGRMRGPPPATPASRGRRVVAGGTATSGRRCILGIASAGAAVDQRRLPTHVGIAGRIGTVGRAVVSG